MTKHGPWEIVRSEWIYQDPWIQLRKDDVIRPGGEPGTHSVVWLKTGVSVLAIDEQDRVYLTDEFHYGIGRHSIEVVSGGIETGEEPLVAAKRELHEELGITARRWIPLGLTDPFTSAIVSPTTLFIAEDLTFGKATPEVTEQIQMVAIPLTEALQMACDGRITHTPTQLLLHRAWMLRRTQTASDSPSQ